MPMLFARRKPHDIAWPDFLYRAALALHPAAARHDDEGLTKRVRVPGCACARLESDESAGNTGGLWRAEKGVQADRAGKPVGRPFAGRL